MVFTNICMGTNVVDRHVYRCCVLIHGQQSWCPSTRERERERCERSVNGTFAIRVTAIRHRTSLPAAFFRNPHRPSLYQDNQRSTIIVCSRYWGKILAATNLKDGRDSESAVTRWSSNTGREMIQTGQRRARLTVLQMPETSTTKWELLLEKLKTRYAIHMRCKFIRSIQIWQNKTQHGRGIIQHAFKLQVTINLESLGWQPWH
jgi:hypothetical protein